MAKKIKRKKKNNIHLKKQARWTIAGLLLATAIIVAFIPVQSNGVSAITAYSVPDKIEDVLASTTADPIDHSIVTGTSVIGTGTPEYAFPMEGETYDIVAYDSLGTSLGTYTYANIDMTTMDVPGNPVAVYQLCKTEDGKTQSNCIKKYLGTPGSGSSPKEPDMVMTLGSTVIVPDESAVPSSEITYFDGEIPTDKSAVVTEYRETPAETSPMSEDVPKQKYIVLEEKVHTYTYTPADPERGISADMKHEETGWQNKRFVVKSGSTSGGTENISRVVYAIANDAFLNASNIKKMEIPSSVVLIGDSAFEGCTNLERVHLSTNCQTIGKKAFANSSKLFEIDLGYATSLSKIGDGAFANTGIDSVTFPSGALSEIGSGAFFRCSKLSSVDFSTTAETPEIKLGCYVFSGCPIESISLNNVTKITSHDKSGNVIETPTKTTNYDFEKAQCGIFTRQADQNTTLKNVVFPSYNNLLPYGTFAGNDYIEYVRFDKPLGAPFDVEKKTSTDPEHWEADEFYYEPENFFIFGTTPSNIGPASYIYAVKNGITYGYMNGEVLTYELTKNGYKYTFGVLNDGECKITNIEKSKIVEPEKEMVIPAKIAQYRVKEIASEAVDVATLDVPTELIIPDTLQIISDRAFVNMPNLTKVTWYDADNSPSSPEINIGNEVFAGDSGITTFNFRDDNHAAEYVNDPNIVSVGKDAFKTLTPSGPVTMKGKMGTGYAPFDYATNKDNRYNTTSATAYATYKSGNPENLVCQYIPSVKNPDGSNGGVVLLSYPTKETDISKENESEIKIKDLTGDISVVEEAIWYSLHNIEIPYGVKVLDEDKTKSDSIGAPLFKDIEDTQNIILYDIESIPDEAFASKKHEAGGSSLNDIVPSSLQSVVFIKDIVEFGETPFANSSNVTSVGFGGEGDSANASSNNPYYWCSNGIIYSYEGIDDEGKELITLEECLPSRGSSGGNTTVDPGNDLDIPRVLNIADKAFMNCDSIKSVDLSSAENLREISKQCFFDADNLGEVILPYDCDSILEEAFSVEKGNKDAPENYIDVYVPDIEVYINASAFDWNKNATLHSYNDSAAYKYAKDHSNVDFKPLTDRVKATYLDYDGKVIAEFTLDAGDFPDEPSPDPTRTGFTFTGWSPKVGKIHTNTTYVAQYSDNSTTTPSTTTPSTTTPSTTGSNTSTTNNTSTNKTTSSSSTTNRSTTSSASSTAKPIIISGAPTPTVPINQGAANAGGNGSGSGSGSGSNGGSKVATGNTNVVSTAHGLTNNGKMSATVNGSSDNYVIKITETPEADESAKQALTGAFGSLENIRYMPFDISLYDSTGSQKISPVPEGVTVSVTMPIPDDLVIYGGNNKIASTTGGSLETLQPRFTVIDGVPCMNYTVSHLSPYVVYVDTANLTADGTLDATPKTGDPIHPKWFLCIGLAAVSIFLFLKRDKVRVA